MRCTTTLAILAASASTSACTSSNPTAANSGTLTVTIDAPTGVTPRITVNGPGQHTFTLTATTTLHGLPPGSYTIAAAPVATSGPIVSTVDTAAVTGSPAMIAEGTTSSATATYSRRPGSGGLWITYFFAMPQTIVQYSAAQLQSSTTSKPAIAVTTHGTEAQSAAFDGHGNLWISVWNTFDIVEYSAEQLASGTSAAPAVTLTQSGRGEISPVGLAFDPDGNLWVANDQDNAVVEYSASQLVSSGIRTSVVTVGSANGSLLEPNGLAFDASGNLWVTTAGSNPVVALSPDQLRTSGNPVPAISLAIPGASGFQTQFLAFDAAGNLWVGVTGVNAIVEIPAIELKTSGTIFPGIVLTPENGSIDPAGLAFDNSGDLWVADFSTTRVLEFSPTQLMASGSPTPIAIIDPGLPFPFGIAFDPPAPNLPFKQ
jgi:sugar lactone lactonase YvrE